MIHPNTELRFISPEKGYGVVATQLIPKGSITWALDHLDRTFSPDEIRRMDAPYQSILEKYCYRDANGDWILCWDISRFVNHSFNSNCITTPYNFELAVRDIQPGEELTDDYGYLNVEEPFDCLPEAGSKRTRVMPDDILHYYPEWDAKVEDAFRYFNKTNQPLEWLIDAKYRSKVSAIAAGRQKMDSILSCYYDPKKMAA